MSEIQLYEHINDTLIIPLDDAVLFPGIATKIKVDTITAAAAEARMAANTKRAIALGLNPSAEAPAGAPPSEESFYKVGVSGEILGIHQADDGALLDFRTNSRVRVERLVPDEKGVMFAPSGEVSPMEYKNDLDEKSHGEMLKYVRESIVEISKNFRGADAFVKPIMEMESLDQIIAAVMPFTPVSTSEKQELLETDSLHDRSLRFIDMLINQKNSVEMQIEIARKSSEQTNKNYREHMLRQQLKAIKEELGENDDETEAEQSYRERIEAADLPEDVKKAALREAGKLEAADKGNPEASMIRNYLDLILDLPWNPAEAHHVDLEEARKVLDENHHGLKDVKERIIQHLAVMILKKEKQGSILLLVGPPGTGKTSLGKSIAQAIGRPYVRASLGGVRDEAEIRGHRRTYIGALPGRIISSMKKAGERNPVFVLDEVDKLSSSYAGDPTSALLEVLDPEQNSSFVDHYLELPYNLSDVLFIGTANSTSGIPGPLLDRTEIIEVSGYTNHEKLRIAADHLVKKVWDDHGLDNEKLLIEDEALKYIIEKYTREAGVRSLGKQLAKIARVASEKIVSGKEKLPLNATVERLEEMLGRPKVRLDDMSKEGFPGVATGLAWTPVGGDILFVEAGVMPGKGALTLTGQLGDVMKESASIALSLVRSRLSHLNSAFDFLKNDVHVHVPAGATPKDGPSAGVTITVALASLLLGKAVAPSMAMTGEITLRGAILPVGGIKEKIIAAHRAGATHIIIPVDNEKDLEDVPKEVRAELKFLPVNTVEELLHAALELEIPPIEGLNLLEIDLGSLTGTAGAQG